MALPFLASAAIGAGAGMLAGQLFSGKKPDLYDAGFFAQRSNQIDSFVSNLASARAKYLTSLSNMYDDAFQRFTANVEPSFANRGLQVSGGAFASALARKSAEFSAQLAPTAFEAERQDIMVEDVARGNLFNQQNAARSGQLATEYKGWETNKANIEKNVGGIGYAAASGSAPTRNPFAPAWDR